MVVNFAFHELGMSAVNADAIRKNTRSRHVLEKAGFRFQECYR
ncbi:GNAT family N-acetyltransferase [Fusicatenibacter saccharivorans]|nr:GNAT family N-acetyltransferase [Blautia sp.]MBT9687778.1 GNAT family N-acetyltransferase [Fusicatenibacter saccharivorans]MCB6810984.1 GNAT family N-acetyltransferase [bacterium MSK18_59]RHS91927.1 N-acetyltransferase [Blautia sp. AM42-2]NSD64198.1 GNAT family N-acetyltransferase [Fusicatenibacter saccharivorans]